MKGEIALKSALEHEMSADQLFERTAGSIKTASLLCVHMQLLIQYGARNCKKIYCHDHSFLNVIFIFKQSSVSITNTDS